MSRQSKAWDALAALLDGEAHPEPSELSAAVDDILTEIEAERAQDREKRFQNMIQDIAQTELERLQNDQ
jgi:hypothetical protein